MERNPAMKKLLALLLVTVTLFSVVGCRKTKSDPDDAPDAYEEQVKLHITDEDYKIATVISGKTLNIDESYSFKRLWSDAEYRSANPEAASVDKNGNITAKNPGTAMVVAKSAAEERTSAIIIVVLPEGSNVNANAAGPQIHEVNTAYMIQPTIQAESFQSSDEKVVQADHNGLLKFLSAGYATVTVTGNGVTEIYSYIVYDRTVTK